MLTFGLLKFFQPFHGWFDVQIRQSHLPQAAILLGKLGEMATGVLFLLPQLRRSLPERDKRRLLLLAGSSLTFEMAVAIYVHLQPQVPPAVLPLGIKPPVIPLAVLVLGIIVVIAVWEERHTEHASPVTEKEGRR